MGYLPCMNLPLIPAYSQQIRATLLWGSLLLSLGGCSTPVKQYAVAQLLPPVPLMHNSPLSLANSKLCQGFVNQWDSVLVIKPYVIPAVIEALPFRNYAAISHQVAIQSLSDNTCTLLFVKSGRYVGYSVVLRTIDFVPLKKLQTTSEIWLTEPDCQRLVIVANLLGTPLKTSTSYSVILTTKK
jgi:hypothetical protein